MIGITCLVLLSGCATQQGTPPRTVIDNGGFEPAPNATFASPTPAHEQPDSRPETPVAIPERSPRDDIDVALSEQLLVEKLVEYRTSLDLDTLSADRRLSRIARQKAYDMGTRGYFSHRDPETGGDGIGRRLARYDYACAEAAELISKTAWKTPLATTGDDPVTLTTESRLAEHVLAGLDGSDPHQAELQRGNVTTVGVGMYVTAGGDVYTAVILCR